MMPGPDERAIRLQKSFEDEVRRSGTDAILSRYLIVVHRSGEQMNSDPRTLALSDKQSFRFTTELMKWLCGISQAHATPDAAAEEIRASSRFPGQFLLFMAVTDFAEWYARPENAKLDAYIPTYLHDRCPILSVEIFIDRA